MTHDQIIAIMTSALRGEAATLISVGRPEAAAAIHDYLLEGNSLSLIRLYDLLNAMDAEARKRVSA